MFHRQIYVRSKCSKHSAFLSGPGLKNSWVGGGIRHTCGNIKQKRGEIKCPSMLRPHPCPLSPTLWWRKSQVVHYVASKKSVNSKGTILAMKKNTLNHELIGTDLMLICCRLKNTAICPGSSPFVQVLVPSLVTVHQDTRLSISSSDLLFQIYCWDDNRCVLSLY